MAKKPKPTSKERRRRKQLEEARQSRVADRHHILFDKCLWDNNGHSELRRDLDMIVTMDRKIHDELHRKVPPIPPLGNSLTMCVTKYYRQLQNSAKREAMGGESNPVIGIALLKMALDMIVKRDKATMLEIRQIELMQDNLDAQVEFILRSNEICGGGSRTISVCHCPCVLAVCLLVLMLHRWHLVASCANPTQRMTWRSFWAKVHLNSLRELVGIKL